MAEDYKFTGWVAHDANSAKGNMKWEQFQPKTWSEDDVDIQVTHSGICATDIHTLRSGWGESMYPLVVGHEIIGKAVRVGKNAGRGIQKGDLVGVGAQSDACMKCEQCKLEEENLCASVTQTFNSKYANGDHAMGGYATHSRVPGRFVFKIPKGLDPADAAPMMCAGITVYTPLKENGCGPGKRIGVAGTGGLGHFAVLFAKAMGAERVLAFSRKGDKRPDTLKMGADEYVALEEDKEWATHHANSLDLIISTISSPTMPLQGFLKLLRPRGRFIQVGAPEDVIPSIHAFDLIPKNAFIGGSTIGNRKDIEEMLELAAKKKIKPWINQRPMSEANTAIQDLEAGKARYRYVLVNKA